MISNPIHFSDRQAFYHQIANDTRRFQFIYLVFLSFKWFDLAPPLALAEFENDVGALGCAVDVVFVKSVNSVLDFSRALEMEGMLVKALDTVEDKTLLYNAVLKIDHKLKALKVLAGSDVLHPILFKKMEQILG